jgi:hypothetical protein
MANEFKHKVVGSELSQTEYESTAGHVFDSQATGDILYATNSTQLSRLGIGSTGAVLTVTGGIPAWDTTWTPTGHLIPASDDSYDLGSASAAWQDLFLEGDITLTDAGTLATSAGALTITSAAAATWSTSAGALTLNGTGGVALQEGGNPIISISDARAITTANTASIALDASGVIELNSSGGALSIGNDNVDQTINIATAGTRTLNIGIGDGTDITTTVVKGTLSVGVDDTGYDVKLFGDTASRYWLWDTSADGVVQRGTLTVGVDDAGHDVIFYGDAASANMTWDASEDDLILNGAARIVVPDGQLVLASTPVSSTAAELNVLDGLARGSVIYGNASAATTALAAGSANTVLKSDGTDIAWGSITVLGTIATGVWEGTDVGVEHGGTGVSTLLTNAVLTGNGTGNIQAESTLLFSSNKLIPTASAHDAAGTALTMSAGATTAGTTNNIAGGALTFQGGQGKGSGAGGDIVFQTANAAGSGSSLNSLATALTLSDDLSAAFAGAVTVAGNLTVNGTTTTVDTTNTTVKDSLIELNNGVADGSNSNDSGLLIERGSTGNNAIFMWDESATGFTVGTTTSTATSTGNLANFTAAPFVAAAITGTAGVFSTSIDITGSTGIILENDETITNSTNGEVAINGTVVVGTGAAAGTLKSSGNFDLTLATGNTTTGTITITDGSNGDIAIAPNGTGAVTVADDLKLTSDSAVLAFGADGDATLTHTDDVGITLNSTNKLMFNDATQFIQGTSGTVLSIAATDEIDLTATAVDLNGTLNVSGVLTTGSTIELGHATATTLSGSSGELSVEGSVVKKVGLEDMWIPAAAMTPTESGGCADIESVETTADRPDLRVLDFDTSSVEKAQFQVVFPKSWDAGTVTFTAYWTASSTNTGTVCWGLAGISMGDGDLIDTAFPTPTNATAKAHSGTVEDLNISATSGNVTITAAADNELVFFELSRQTGSDDYNADARLIGIKLHYTTEASTDA